MTAELILLAASTLLAEDLACFAAGALVASGRLGFVEASGACLAGIAAGDIGLYFLGRIVGRRVIGLWPLRSLIKAAQIEKASEWLARRGALVVLASRFTPGMRLPMYLAAGVLRTNALVFCMWFLIASALWTPVLVALSAYFGSETNAALTAAVAGAGLIGIRYLVGFLRCLQRWEFLPGWVGYLPVIPWIVALAVRYRSLTLFTASNPGIETGGLAGESKSRILQALSPSGAVAPFQMVCGSAAEIPFSFPMVVKPDVGERGSGVSIVRSTDELSCALASIKGAAIVQEYVPGVEFGVFYRRYPHESRGRVISITEKRFPAVIGDGRRTLRELILSDRRAGIIAPTYLNANRDRLNTVPADGESIQLVEIGSHCRGAIFLDGMHLLTGVLEQRIDEISKTHAGFFFGRYDLKAASMDAFQRGEVTVIELNGVAAEPAHIYDPAVSLWSAYGALFRHWSDAFEIGAQNRARGAETTPIPELLRIAAARAL